MWQADIEEGLVLVNKIGVLSSNWQGEDFAQAKVFASGVQCDSLISSDDGATWYDFECPQGTLANQIKVERNEALVFCGIKVWG